MVILPESKISHLNGERRSGFMISALVSRSSHPGSSPGQGHWWCSWAKHFTLIVPLSTQVYKWVQVTLRWLETVSSTFLDLEFAGSLQPLYTC